MAQVLDGFEDFNTRVCGPHGFRLSQPARERGFLTPSGRAEFSLAPLPGDADPGQGRLMLATLRSHDQFNTTIYSNNDRYRATAAAGRRVGDAMITCPKTHGPESGLEQVRAFFEDDHVHMALVVTRDGRLVTTIERRDLAAAIPSSAPVAKLGTLTGRTAGAADSLSAATATLLRERRRRLAVVDDSGRLLGLLCLKKDGTGYCSDEGIRARRG